jgi:hypothetical protein
VKRRLWLSMVIIAFLSAGFLSYVQRYRIESILWHWIHGYTTSIGSYEVPVPDHWLPRASEHGVQTTLVHSRFDDSRGSPLSNVGVIVISSRPVQVHDLDGWKAQIAQRLERDGVGDIETKSLKAGNEVIACVGGRQLAKVLGDSRATAVSLSCISEGGLIADYTGPTSGVADFYSILSATRRKGS